MIYKVKKIPQPTYEGQLLPLLITEVEEWIPEPSAALWGWELWHTQKFNTASGRLRDIAVFYEYIYRKYPQFFEDAAKLKLLDVRRVTDISSFFLINFKENIDIGLSVSPSTFNRRIDSLVLFLEFHYGRYINRLSCIDSKDKHGRQLDKLLNRIRKFRYKPADIENSTKSAEPVDPSLIELIRLIRLIIRPSSNEFNNPLNPFRKQLQLRNAALILMLYELGGRASEIVLLREADLNLSINPTVFIRNSTDNSEYRGRRDGASHKTLNRELPISRGLAGLLLDYIEEVRPILRKRSKKGKTPFLFVSEHDGGALTISGLEHMVSSLFKKTPDISLKLHPHQFRVSRGIEIRKAIDADFEGKNSPMTKAGDMQDTLTAWGGWSSTSQMPRHYTKAQIQQSIRNYLERSENL